MVFCSLRKGIVTVLLCLFSAASPGVFCDAPGWKITQLTKSDGMSNAPDISGRNVVWQTGIDGHFEVSLYDGSTGDITQLPGSPYGNSVPRISGNNVVWLGGRYNNPYTEVYFYDGASGDVSQLTESPTLRDNRYPEICGKDVVWQSQDLSPWTSWVFIYYGLVQGTLPLFSGSYPEQARYPRMCETDIVWESSADGNGSEIYLNGNRLTCNTYDDTEAQISDGNVAWMGNVEAYIQDWEIFVYYGDGIIRLTDNTVDDEYPRISGFNVVWQSWDGNDWEIFLYDGANVTQLTDNDVNDLYPEISRRQRNMAAVGRKRLGGHVLRRNMHRTDNRQHLRRQVSQNIRLESRLGGLRPRRFRDIHRRPRDPRDSGNDKQGLRSGHVGDTAPPTATDFSKAPTSPNGPPRPAGSTEPDRSCHAKNSSNPASSTSASNAS